MTLATELTGPALDAAVEAALGTPMGCWNADGSENRERINSALNRYVSPNSTLGHGVWHRKAYLPDYNPTIEFETPCNVRGTDWLWANRAGQPWQSAIEAHVRNYRVPARPFHRDLTLAVGLLAGEDFTLDDSAGHTAVFLGRPRRCRGNAVHAEFPDAKDDERRVLAMATAICRAFLSAKS